MAAVDLYGEPVVHRVSYDDRTVDMSTYEVGIVARLAENKVVPTAGALTAAFINRLSAENLGPAKLTAAIRRADVEIPVFEVMDDPELMRSRDFHVMVEAILTQHLDRWIEMDRD